MAKVEHADLVVVGAGTVGGWASWFAKTAGAGRVVVLERGLVGQGASSRAAGIVRAQGGTPTTVALGRWSIDFYRRQAAEIGTDSGFRELGYLILAVTEDDELAARERIVMQQAQGLPVRWLTASEAAAEIPSLSPVGHRGGTLPGDRRPHRPAAQRSCLLARDAAGRRRAPRADGFHRSPARAAGGRWPTRRRRRNERRNHRHRARDPDRRPGFARGRCHGRHADPGRRRPSHRRGARAARDVRNGAPVDGLRHRRGSVLAARGGRPALRLERSERSAGRGALDRLDDVRRDARTAGGVRSGDSGPRAAQDLGRHDRLHARPPADPRARADR